MGGANTFNAVPITFNFDGNETTPDRAELECTGLAAAFGGSAFATITMTCTCAS